MTINIENFMNVLDNKTASQLRHDIYDLCPINHFFNINDMPTSLLRNLPFHFYWKDCEGTYLGCNDTQAKTDGLDCGEQILGLTDFDSLPAEEAETIRNTDLSVITSKNLKFLHEKIILTNGNNYCVWSYKWPLYSTDNKVIGVLGVSFIITLERPSINTSSSQIVDIIIQQPTFREKECLYYLAKGLSAKGIARILKISYRTVQHHLDSAKSKMGCFSREELIEKIWLLPDVKNKLCYDLIGHSLLSKARTE